MEKQLSCYGSDASQWAPTTLCVVDSRKRIEKGILYVAHLKTQQMTLAIRCNCFLVWIYPGFGKICRTKEEDGFLGFVVDSVQDISSKTSPSKSPCVIFQCALDLTGRERKPRQMNELSHRVWRLDRKKTYIVLTSPYAIMDIDV